MPAPTLLSCHCGDIRLEVDAAVADLYECNCSTCRRTGFLHWKVPAAKVRLVAEKRALTTYVWRDLNGGHHFCRTCGTGIFNSGYPDGLISLNARCIEGIDVFTLDIRRYDGRNKMPPGPLP